MSTSASTIRRVPTAAWWLFALIAAAFLLAATSFTTRDADSRVYITIASKLVSEPLHRWIAPQWWGAWGMQGLFREHPIGTFMLPALLGRAGYPSVQTSFVITLAAQIVSLWVFVTLAERAAPAPAARSLAWTLQLLPIAFVFRIRANQEYSAPGRPARRAARRRSRAPSSGMACRGDCGLRVRPPRQRRVRVPGADLCRTLDRHVGAAGG